MWSGGFRFCGWNGFNLSDSAFFFFLFFFEERERGWSDGLIFDIFTNENVSRIPLAYTLDYFRDNKSDGSPLFDALHKMELFDFRNFRSIAGTIQLKGLHKGFTEGVRRSCVFA